MIIIYAFEFFLSCQQNPYSEISGLTRSKQEWVHVAIPSPRRSPSTDINHIYPLVTRRHPLRHLIEAPKFNTVELTRRRYRWLLPRDACGFWCTECLLSTCCWPNPLPDCPSWRPVDLFHWWKLRTGCLRYCGIGLRTWLALDWQFVTHRVGEIIIDND